MSNSPFKMPGMAFKEGQTPMRKISLKKVLSKFKAGVEKKITNVVENVKNYIKKAVSRKNNIFII